jgi:hypothetical protein
MATILNGSYHDDIRAMLGVTADELPDAEVDSPYILPFVEAVMVRYLPSWEDLDEELGYLAAFRKATCLRVAVACIPRMKLRLGQYESDNKSIFQRFKTFSWEDLENDLWRQYAEAILMIPALAGELPVRDILTVVSPAVDVITG